MLDPPSFTERYLNSFAENSYFPLIDFHPSTVHRSLFFNRHRFVSSSGVTHLQPDMARSLVWVYPTNWSPY